MLGTIERKLTIGFLAATVVVIVMGCGFYQAAQRFYANDRRVEWGHELVGETRATSTLFKDLEASQHGFFLTGDAALRQSALGDITSLPGKVERLAALAAGSPEQTAAAAKEFKVYYAKVAGKSSGSYSMDHSAASFVFDPAGKVRLFVPYGSDPKTLAADIKQLAAA